MDKIEKLLKILREYGIPSSAVLKDEDKRLWNGVGRGRYGESKIGDDAMVNRLNSGKLCQFASTGPKRSTYKQWNSGVHLSLLGRAFDRCF